MPPSPHFRKQNTRKSCSSLSSPLTGIQGKLCKILVASLQASLYNAREKRENLSMKSSLWEWRTNEPVISRGKWNFPWRTCYQKRVAMASTSWTPVWGASSVFFFSNLFFPPPFTGLQLYFSVTTHAVRHRVNSTPIRGTGKGSQGQQERVNTSRKISAFPKLNLVNLSRLIPTRQFKV